MPNIVHFEIPADDIQRAKKFYASLFGWKIESVPEMDYNMIDTFSAPGGGMMKRIEPNQQITEYIGVPSVDEYSAKVEQLGGKIIVPKKAVPGMGYFVICMDTEIVNKFYMCSNFNIFAEHFQHFCPIQETPPSRSHGLISSQNDRVLWIWKHTSKMVHNSSTSRHSTSRNDDAGMTLLV